MVTEAGRLLSVVDLKISYVLILAVKVLTLGSDLVKRVESSCIGFETPGRSVSLSVGRE